jgi:flavin-dependent dehydrogenase
VLLRLEQEPTLVRRQQRVHSGRGAGQAVLLPGRRATGSDRAIASGWLALGDALIALDPLSASGITGALEDAIAAAETIGRLLGVTDNGETRDIRSAYAARANATLMQYLAERCAIYGRDNRWRKYGFWQRRVIVIIQ